MVFGRDDRVELGFANFKEKENPFTRVASSAVFGSSNSSSTTAIPDNPPPVNTSENVSAADPSRSFFGAPTSNSFPTPAPAPVVDIQPRPLFGFRPFDTPPPNSTSAFGQPLSSPFSTSPFHQSSSNPFSGSQTTAGGLQQSSGGAFFTSRIGNGDQPFVTNPATSGVATISTCAFQQPSNTVPPNPLFSGPSFKSLSSSQPGGPCCISSSHDVSQSGGHHSSGWSPFSSGISSLPAVSQAGGQHSSGWHPFSSVVSSSPATPLFNVDPLPSSKSPFSVNPFNSDRPVITSPFLTKLPFSGLVVPTVDSRLGGFTTSSTKSLVQENNTSVFAPFTRSNGRVCDIQGTRICSYEPTPAGENNLCNEGNLISISAMPMYNEKSHEELRLEDYGLRHTPLFRFPNKSSTDSLPLRPSISTTCTNPLPTSSPPLHHPVMSIPLSIEIRHLGDLLAKTQVTIPVPTSGTVPPSNRATETEAIITSIPEPVSTGGFPWPPYPRQKPAEPVRTEATDTLPTTVPNGISVKSVPPETTVTLPTTTVPNEISGLTISENHESRPPVEKYKPDDEDVVKFRKFFDVMAMIPKLKCPKYYTVPSVGDLIENELKNPGSCSQVKDFVIGKRGYGSIKFLGETDVRNLDLESMVQFNTREVIFCMDQNTKPAIGQGLNKAAEITLNVDCIDKNTGKRYIDGPKVDKYKEVLVKKSLEQGAEFVSFDPVKGEWKFKVQHF